MKLEKIMQSKISQTQKNIVQSHLHDVFIISKLLLESRSEDCKVCTEGGMGSDYWIAFIWGDENVLITFHSGDGCTTWWMYLMPMKCTLKIS